MGTLHHLPLRSTAHPVFTAAEIATMSASELDYFTDAPVAHLVAEADYRRQLYIDRRNAEVIRAHTARLASARRMAQVAWS